MIAIVNIDKNVRKDGPHQYELRINSCIIAQFTHNREEPLHECLLKAAIAAEEKAVPDSKRKISIFTKPRYDDVFFQGLANFDI